MDRTMNGYRETQRAHDEYAQLTGRLVHTCTITNYDPRAKAWIKRTVEYIDIGRPDPVQPSPDKQLTREKMWHEQNNTAAMKVNAAAAAERFAAMEKKITAYLEKHGPTHIAHIARDLDYAQTTTNSFVTRRENSLYCRVGKCGKTVLWGLVGVHDKEGVS